MQSRKAVTHRAISKNSPTPTPNTKALITTTNNTNYKISSQVKQHLSHLFGWHIEITRRPPPSPTPTIQQSSRGEKENRKEGKHPKIPEMSGCFENINFPACEWFEGGDRKNAFASIASGILFFTGWWIIIDIAAAYPDSNVFNHAYHTCGVVGTISLFMINVVSNAQVRGDAYTNGCMGPRGARVWLFIGFVLGFVSVFAACWILFADFIPDDKKSTYPGVGLFLQNIFIFIASLLFKFGRSEDMWG
ncbi:transmembrane protein 50A isoform X2 [Neocloeon triangulifer]|uniref:transmembrane protein 50A isoform X2 n=1 Tax=Neocloeon triangulifer TaxID=2078957 RepID=UPI00286EB618|nr:transmembrane protein 50A isoform X2 [Neocloeon triangulifer]